MNETAPIYLAWDDGWLPPQDLAGIAENAVREDIAKNLALLEHPSDLVFHHVQLSADADGPTVFVYGRKGSRVFQCRYDAKPQWKTSEEIARG